MQGVGLKTRTGQWMPESCLTDDSEPQARFASSSLLLHLQSNIESLGNKSRQHLCKRTKPNPTHNIHRTPPIMSGAAQGSQNTTKAVVSDSKDTSQPLQPQKPGAQLEEDDEFEDFPVEGTRTRKVKDLSGCRS
jgi:hypothetical protein